MHRYAAVMVNAYSQVSGRSLEGAISDLELTGLIELDEVSNLSDNEIDHLSDILMNHEAVASLRQRVSDRA